MNIQYKYCEHDRKRCQKQKKIHKVKQQKQHSRIYQSTAGATTLRAAAQTMFGSCVNIEAIGDVTLADAFSVPPVMSTCHTVTGTRAPAATPITEPRTTSSKHAKRHRQLTADKCNVSIADNNNNIVASGDFAN